MLSARAALLPCGVGRPQRTFAGNNPALFQFNAFTWIQARRVHRCRCVAAAWPTGKVPLLLLLCHHGSLAQTCRSCLISM